jgi:Histidine kinase-, DNA gyrase B-, and HSP90-like ATPase
MSDSVESPAEGAASGAPPARRRRGSREVTTGKLRVHDPFELVRWLALSQPDPRKALAELVQNSLDAGARHVRVTRLRRRRVPMLTIWDDGEGVIPELDRTEALRYIATHVGHSRKRTLTPQQRLELMTQGQYGIGLLGFWSLGEMLEMRTVVPGQRGFRLLLYRDRPDFLIEPLRGRLPLDERWTEVVVHGLHRGVVPALLGRRAAGYLASELRGQLLDRDVRLVVEDHIARGATQKVIPVRPRRFLGERLEGLERLEVTGRPPVRLEIYLVGEGGRGAHAANAADAADGTEPEPLAIYSAGTLVAESFHDLAPLGLDRPPWTDRRLTGMVDFPDLRVAPGSRRGVIPDEAASAFADALTGVEPVLRELLSAYEERRAEELDRVLIKNLQRAFRDFWKQRPRYTMLPVEGRRDEESGPATGGQAAVAASVEGAADEAGVEAGEVGLEEPPPLAQLFAPGPLAEVRLTPSPLRVECGGERHARARAVDADGRDLEEPVTYRWRLTGPVGRLKVRADPRRVLLTAADRPGEGRLGVQALAGGRDAQAEIPVEVVEELPSSRSDEGIPEPELLNLPGAPWRSRIADGRWQVNAGHREYRAISDQPSLKLRYLAMLFAKEVVLRSSQDPRLEGPLEQLVEIAAYADRRLATGRGGRKKRVPAQGS